MKRRLTAFAAAALLASGPSFAGTIDAPAEDPPVAPLEPIVDTGPDWTGFYAGGQLGYADIGTSVAGVDGDGFIGGLTAGYDYDFGNWVIGAGLDYDWADISLAPGLSVERVFRAKLRGGYKVGDGLIYATGGYAEAETDLLGSDDGYFIGAGYEHMVAENISVAGEVLYHEFDNFNATPVDVDATTVQLRGTFRF